MKKLLILVLILTAAFYSKAQTPYTIATDTLKLITVSGINLEKPIFQLRNKYRDSLGYVLTNIGNGNYNARAPKKYIDSMRRVGVNVYGYINGSGILQYTDSVGAGSPGGNTASSLGGGLAILSGTVGLDFRFNTLNGTDFNLASNLISIDYANGQAAGAASKGFLTAFDWNLFNNKIDPAGSYVNPSWLVSLPFSKITANPTTLAGYGIVDAQPLDADLTAIAGLSPTNDDIIQRKAGVWTNRTVAQYKSDLALNNVANSLQVINSGGTPSILSDILANRPAAGTSGRLYVSTNENKIYRDNGTIWVELGDGAGTGEANLGSNLGGGLANYDSKSGVTLRFNSFATSDFNLASNLISIDYTNGQAASGSLKGFLTAADYTFFSGKETPLTFNQGLTRAGNTVTNNLITGVSGGQTITGSTSTNSGLIFKTTSGVGTTGANFSWVSGNNGATPLAILLNNGNFGIGTTTPNYILELNSTGAIGIPFGNDAQRPTVASGTRPFRFNILDSSLEVGVSAGVWFKYKYTIPVVVQDGADILKGSGPTIADTIRTGGPIYDFIDSVGNSGTGEDDLFTYTAAANRLRENGEKIEIKAVGTFEGSSSSKQVKLYFGGTQIYATGVLTVGSDADWVIEAVGTRMSSSVIKWSITFTTTASGAPVAKYTRVNSVNFATTQIIKITGETSGSGTANNDVVAQIGTIYYWPPRAPLP